MRHKVQSNKKLWKRVQNGTAEATIVVVENKFYIDAIAYRLAKAGADLGHDVNFKAMMREAALCMIEHAPVMRLPDVMRGSAPRLKCEIRSERSNRLHSRSGVP